MESQLQGSFRRNVIENFSYAIVFEIKDEKKDLKKKQELIKFKLNENHVDIYEYSSKEKKEDIFFLKFEKEEVILKLLEAAKQLQIEKPSLEKDQQTNFQQEKYRRYIRVQEDKNFDPRIKEIEDKNFKKFDFDQIETAQYYQSPNNQSEPIVFQEKIAKKVFFELFTEAEQKFIMYYFLMNITFPESLLDKIHKELHNIPNNQSEPLKSDQSVGSQKMLNMIEYFQDRNTISQFIPMHNNDKKYKDYSLMQIPNMNEIKKINNYFGEEIAFYFYFLHFTLKWLIAPSILAIIIYSLNKYYQLTVKTSMFEGFQSLFIIFWTTFLLLFWKKREIEIRIENRSFGSSFNQVNKLLKHQYLKKIKNQRVLDQVTGQEIAGVNQMKQYAISFLRLFPFILATGAFLVSSINIRGLVDSQHMLFFESLYNLSTKGGILFLLLWRVYLTLKQFNNLAILDKDGPVGWLPGLLHVIILAKINEYYQIMCNETNKNEAHQTLAQYQNSLILKRFFFEFFSYFSDILYLAFLKCDFQSVNQYLRSLFVFDELRRIITETGIPLITQRINMVKKSLSSQKKAEIPKKSDKIQGGNSISDNEQQYLTEKVAEVYAPKYVLFDDYIEIIMNFGYLTLFVSAFDGIALIILVFNAIEYFSDKHKLYHLYQRPIPQKCKGILQWNNVLFIWSILTVLSNIVLFAYISDQIIYYFPFLFDEIKQTNVNVKLLKATPVKGKGKIMIVIVFVMEHLFFLILFLIRKYFNSIKQWYDIYQERIKYKHSLRLKPME